MRHARVLRLTVFLLVLGLFAPASVVFAAGNAIGNEGATGSGTQPPEEGSVPPPAPVATEDIASLICPKGGGKYVQYEVRSSLEGVSCTKTSTSAVCRATDGRAMAAATCERGCTVYSSTPGNGVCTETKGTTKGAVTR